MALWDIASRLLTQLASSSVGLAIKRFSSGATGHLQEWQDETGAPLLAINQYGEIKQVADGTVGVKVTRSSATGSADLVQMQTETGTTLSGFRSDGSAFVNGYTDWTMLSGLTRIEWRLFGMGTGSELRIWNQDEGKFHWRAYTDRIEVAAVRPGAINPYNSLTAMKMAGLATASGAPTASTWVAGDWFIDSKGVSQLCTTGGAIGTAVFASGGWQLAGFYKFASALATSGAITVAAFDELMIVVRVVSMSAATEWPSLRFNGDTATNYSHGQTFTTAGTSAIDATATVTNRQQASAGAAKISGQVSAGARTIVCYVSNASATSKVGRVESAIGSGAASTLPVKDISAQFEWVNTSAQITSVTMLTMASGANVAGTTTFAIGSGFQVFGRDLA